MRDIYQQRSTLLDGVVSTSELATALQQDSALTNLVIADAIANSATSLTNQLTSDFNSAISISESNLNGLISNKVDWSSVGVPYGVATLDDAGLIPVSALPSYVSDVVMSDTVSSFPNPGESNKIYVDRSTGKQYRWAVDQYVMLPSSPGTTDDIVEGTKLYFTTARAAEAAPVQSVAGRTGAVALSVTDISGLATVATTGDYSDLTNKPSIPVVPTKLSRFTNDSNFITASGAPVQSVAGRTGAVILSASDIGGLSTVATTGSYNDLSNKPSIPVVPTKLSQFTNDSNFITASGAPVQSVAGRTGAVTLAAADIGGLATVATTGSYNDLSNKPSIPTVPTKVSSFSNDAGYIKADGTVQMTGEFISAKKAGTSAAVDNVASIHVRNNDGTGDSDLAAVQFQCGSNYSTKLYLRADGYFGVGGGSHAAWAMYLDSNANLVVSGDVTAYSDPQLKENIRPLTYAQDRLGALTAYNFTWKYGIPHVSHKAGEADVGLLATEVEEIFPEFIKESIDVDGKRYKTVTYSKFIPVLIQAFKELQEEVNQLKAKLPA